MTLNDLVNDDDVKSYFAANVTMASAKAKSFLYKLDDDAVAASEMHNGRKDTLNTLRSMRKEEKWWAAASCGYRQCGKPGLSAGMLMMTKRNRDVILPHIDDEGITGDPRMITAVLKGDTTVTLKHVYGHVGMGLKEPTSR